MASMASTLMIAALFGSQALATRYYVDCSQSIPGTGSRAQPWNSLDQVNEPIFKPGDVISFKTGSTFTGSLHPKGGGRAGEVIRITKYTADSTDGSMDPVIDGNGAAAAVTLTNQDHWHISNLRVTNEASGLAARQGIHVTASDGHPHTGITIDANSVYKVAGQTNKAKHARDFILSCGILVDATGGSRYDGVLVTRNNVSHCGGGGIKVRVGSMENRGLWTRVRDNRIDSCGGDGIIISYSESPTADYNTATNLGRGTYPWSGGNFAGIWVLGNHNPTIAHNVVVNTSRSVQDSQAFDCDWGNTGNCTVEYNFNRDNAGGAFMNCDGCGIEGGADQIVRYNIFQNDCRLQSNGDLPTLYFYNNIVYCPDQDLDIEVPPRAVFSNNIWVGNSKSKLPAYKGISWRWNVISGVEPPTKNGIPANPGFVDPGKGRDTLDSLRGYYLRAGSPALSNGEVIAANGGEDFWGYPVSATSKPNRGAYNGPGVWKALE